MSCRWSIMTSERDRQHASHRRAQMHDHGASPSVVNVSLSPGVVICLVLELQIQHIEPSTVQHDRHSLPPAPPSGVQHLSPPMVRESQDNISMRKIDKVRPLRTNGQ